MNKSIDALQAVLSTLTRQARSLGLTDTEWATRAAVRKETLSRLRQRRSCDFATLQALAQVVGARVGVLDANAPGSTADGHFPAKVSRDLEERLLELCASRDLGGERWKNLGPAFFMAGLAVMVASVKGFDRGGLCALAEQLHTGSSNPEVFQLWLNRSPVRPSRFLPMLEKMVQRAA
ncbi:MAG: hypothetical protein ACRETU_08265 [Steroidobacterales bacterium]